MTTAPMPLPGPCVAAPSEHRCPCGTGDILDDVPDGWAVAGAWMIIASGDVVIYRNTETGAVT